MGERLARALERADLDEVAALYADGAVVYHPLMPTGVRGRDAIRDSEADLLAAFGDVAVEVRNLVAEGSTCVAEVVLRATHRGPLDVGDEEPLAATGRRIELPSVWCFDLDDDGSVVEERDYFDSATLMTQLGLAVGEG